MDKTVLLVFAVTMALATLITFYQHIHDMGNEPLMNQEYFVIRSADLAYEGCEPILHICIVDTGEILVKVLMVHLYYEVLGNTHCVGASAFVEKAACPGCLVVDPIIVLYGSNPIPPKHEAVFKAKLLLFSDYVDENGPLKPGTYIVRVETEKDVEAFYTIRVWKRE